MSNILGRQWTDRNKSSNIEEVRKAETYKYDIDAIYRVRDASDKSKEYYFYQKKGRVENDNGDIETTNSLTYGYVVEKEHELKWNQVNKCKEPVRMRDNPTYLLKCYKDEVLKLLEGSEKSCFNFYLGTAVTTV